LSGTSGGEEQQQEKLDRKTKKLQTIHGQHHPKADIHHLYVPRKQGGRGLMQLLEAYIVEITKLMAYVDSTEDPQIQILRTPQWNTNSAMLQTARSFKMELQRGTRQIRTNTAEKTKET
jgi:hypothetical protein